MNKRSLHWHIQLDLEVPVAVVTAVWMKVRVDSEGLASPTVTVTVKSQKRSCSSWRGFDGLVPNRDLLDSCWCLRSLVVLV